MMTVKQVADSLNLSPAAVYRYLASGDLESHRFGNAIRISENQLTEFVERKRVAADTERFSGLKLKHL